VEALAAGIEQLLASETLRTRFAESARRHVEQQFDMWERGRLLADFLRSTETRTERGRSAVRHVPNASVQ
jgi:hypothetical protein